MTLPVLAMWWFMAQRASGVGEHLTDTYGPFDSEKQCAAMIDRLAPPPKPASGTTFTPSWWWEFPFGRTCWFTGKPVKP